MWSRKGHDLRGIQAKIIRSRSEKNTSLEDPGNGNAHLRSRSLSFLMPWTKDLFKKCKAYVKNKSQQADPDHGTEHGDPISYTPGIHDHKAKSRLGCKAFG